MVPHFLNYYPISKKYVIFFHPHPCPPHHPYPHFISISSIPPISLTYIHIRVQQMAFVTYVYMPNFTNIQMILDMHMLTCMLTFSQRISKFSNFFWFLLCYLFKNLLLYIWPLIYLFVLGRDSFFTVYIWFKETLFFNSSYKLLNKHFSLPQSTCQIRVPVRNKLK